jgi:general secretion pathway protein K
MALMSVLAAAIAHTSAVELRLARTALATLQADALARSAVAAAAVVLREVRASGAPDTLDALGAAGRGRQPLGAGWVEVQVEDEARRLDLDRFSGTLPRLLELLDLDPRVAEAVADWVDLDDAPRPHGAERDWYLGLTPPYVPRNGRLRTVGELGLVRGVDAAAAERLRPFVTAVGEPAVNPNTAPAEVLRALGADRVSVDRLLATRARRAVAPHELGGLLAGVPAALLTLGSRHYTVRVVATVGDVRRAVEATLSVPEGLDPAIVGWRPLPPD